MEYISDEGGMKEMYFEELVICGGEYGRRCFKKSDLSI